MFLVPSRQIYNMTTLLTTVLAAGQGVNIMPGGQFANLGDITLASIISAVIVLVLVVAALIFFFMLVLGGIKYITSGGDKGQTEAARGQITAALIGLVIVFAAWAIINLINLFFGVNILGLDVPSAQPSNI
jgi:hypothetical protein